MRKIVAFAGKAGSGKDYRCQQLVNTQGYKKIAFADALRKIAFATMGYTYDYALEHYDELKKTALTTNGLTMRNIMENLGTEGIRKYDNDFWVRCMIKEIQATPEDTNICISDLRFYNEYEGLSKFCEDNDYKFKLIFCDFHSARYENYNPHASARLAQFLYDLGYRDGEEVKGEVMQAYIQSMREIPTKV